MDELPRQLALVESPALGCVDGRERPALLFDNATSTPPLQGVLDAVAAFLTWYGSVQRRDPQFAAAPPAARGRVLAH